VCITVFVAECIAVWVAVCVVVCVSVCCSVYHRAASVATAAMRCSSQPVAVCVAILV